MSFADALAWEEVEETALAMGLDAQVVHFINQCFESNPDFAHRRIAEGGVSHYLACELAILKGGGIIDAANRYHGPIPGRTGPDV